jgi:hypothetical protein
MVYGVIRRDLLYVRYFSHMGGNIPRNIMFTLYNNTLAVSTATMKDSIFLLRVIHLDYDTGLYTKKIAACPRILIHFMF